MLRLLGFIIVIGVSIAFPPIGAILLLIVGLALIGGGN